MASVEITQRVLADLERLIEFIAAEDPHGASRQILSGRKAFEPLADHRQLGRAAEEGRRELILSQGRYGYIEKMRWLAAEDGLLMLAVRHPLEAASAGECQTLPALTHATGAARPVLEAGRDPRGPKRTARGLSAVDALRRAVRCGAG